MENIFVVDDRSFEVTLSQQTSRSILVTIQEDAHAQWTFELAGWRPCSFGVGRDGFYLWSARQLIVFPKSEAPIEWGFDEDLLLVFNLEIGWVLVCETSVRLLFEGIERDRLEFDEVIEAAHWDGGHLIVRDVEDIQKSVVIHAGGIIVESLKAAEGSSSDEPGPGSLAT